MGDYENLRLYDSWGEYPGSGAYHGVELSELFGTAQNVSGEVSSAEQQRFSRYMQGAWAAFGRDPWRGLTEECGWLSYNESSESLVKLAPGGGGGVLREIVDPGVYDGRCPRVEDNDPMPGRGAF
jgi:carboxylesterase type B